MEVGRSRYSLIDNSRHEVLGGGYQGRAIEVVLYYPIEKDEPEKAEASVAPYIVPDKFEKLHPMYKSKIKKTPNVSAVYDDLTPAEGKFPVVFFSHGYGGYAEQNSRMCVDLVKSGFIVVSVGHAYEASCIKMDDGRIIPYNNKIKTTSPMIPALISQFKKTRKPLDPVLALESFDEFQNKYCSFLKTRVKVWADDIEYVYKNLRERENDEYFILGNKMDFSKGVGTTGHSFGGCASFYLCMYNPDFTCGINIDGAIFGDYDGLLKTPFMQISCEKNVNFESRAIAARKEDVYRVIFKNMQHLGFSDAKVLFGTLNTGKMSIEKLENTMFSAHREFFSKYLKGEDNDFEYLKREVGDEIVFEQFKA